MRKFTNALCYIVGIMGVMLFFVLLIPIVTVYWVWTRCGGKRLTVGGGIDAD